MKGIMRKILLAFGIFLGLLIIAAVVIPFVVNVDKFRPQIQQAADQKLNGKLELGKLSLSLWGQIRVQVDGLKLLDAQGRPVVSVKDAYFHLPFTSIIADSPSLTLSMRQPDLNVVKEKDGKFNVMTLMKTSAQPPAGAPSQAPAQPAPQKGEVKLPGIVTHARLGIDINHALLNYQDQVSGMRTRVRDLNIEAHNLSLSHQMNLQVTAHLNTQGKATGNRAGWTVQGPAELTATANPHVIGGTFQSMDVNAHLNLNDVEILEPGLFHKQKGVKALADLALKVSPQAAQIDQMTAKFFNAVIQGQGNVTNLGAKAAPGTTVVPSPVVHFVMKSNTIDLGSWNQLVPMLSQYQLGGNADFNAEVNGPSDKLGYKALLKVNALTARAPDLKAQPRIDAVVSVITDQIDHMSLTMKAPGNDLVVQGKVVNFQAPKADFEVTSNGMDLDQLIAFPAKTATGTGTPAGAPTTGGAATQGRAVAKSNYDAMLDPLRANKIVQNTVARIGVNIRSIKVHGVTVSDILGKMSMRDLVASVDSLGMKLFGGTIKASASTNLQPKMPTYRFNASVNSLDLSQAVASQYHLFKNTLIGKANFDMTGNGASFNPDPAKSNLNAKGKLRVNDAEFTSIDVGKMVSEALNNALVKVGNQIPALKGKRIIGNLPNGKSRYQSVSTNFTISNGKFVAPDFVAKAAPKQGIDLKGDVAVGLINYSLKANFLVIDTYNLTKARDLSVNQNGVDVNHILAKGNSAVEFPVSVGCTLTAPCYSYTQVPQYLAKVALNNATGALRGKAKSELQKRANELIKKAPPSLQKQLQGLGKSLFGH